MFCLFSNRILNVIVFSTQTHKLLPFCFNKLWTWKQLIVKYFSIQPIPKLAIKALQVVFLELHACLSREKEFEFLFYLFEIVLEVCSATLIQIHTICTVKHWRNFRVHSFQMNENMNEFHSSRNNEPKKEFNGKESRLK